MEKKLIFSQRETAKRPIEVFESSRHPKKRESTRVSTIYGAPDHVIMVSSLNSVHCYLSWFVQIDLKSKGYICHNSCLKPEYIAHKKDKNSWFYGAV